MASRWIDWIRKFASDNNMTYACALSDPECAESYREEYNKKAKPKKPKKSLFDKTSEARAIMLRENAKKSLAKTQASQKNIPANPDTIGALKLAPNRLSIDTTPIELPETVVPRRAAAAVAEVVPPVAKKTKSKKTKASAEESVKMPPIPASLKPIGVAYDYLLNNQSATLPENMIGRIPAESGKVIPTDSHHMFTVGRRFLTADFAYSGDKFEERKLFPYVIVYEVIRVSPKMIGFVPFKEGGYKEAPPKSSVSFMSMTQRSNEERKTSIVDKFVPLTDEEALLIYNRPEALKDSKFVYKGKTKVSEEAQFLDFLDRLNANRDSPPYVNIFEGIKLWLERGNKSPYTDKELRSMRIDAELIKQLIGLIPKYKSALDTYERLDIPKMTPERLKQDAIFPQLAWRDKISIWSATSKIRGDPKSILNRQDIDRDDPEFIQKIIAKFKDAWTPVSERKRVEEERSKK